MEMREGGMGAGCVEVVGGALGIGIGKSWRGRGGTLGAEGCEGGDRGDTGWVEGMVKAGIGPMVAFVGVEEVSMGEVKRVENGAMEGICR